MYIFIYTLVVKAWEEVDSVRWGPPHEACRPQAPLEL